jgi:hypothetical protein
MHDDRHNHLAPGRPAPAHHERQQLGLDAPSSEVPRAQDHWRVDLAQEWEVTFWSREFSCSESELRSAVEAVGSKAGAVRAHLASQIQQQRS